MNQLPLDFDAVKDYPRRKNGKLTVGGLALYLEDNQDKIISGELSMRQMREFAGSKTQPMDRGTITKIAKENGLEYKKEEQDKYFNVPISLFNIPWTKDKIQSIA